MIAIGTLFAFLADTIFSSLNKNGYLSAEMVMAHDAGSGYNPCYSYEFIHNNDT